MNSISSPFTAQLITDQIKDVLDQTAKKISSITSKASKVAEKSLYAVSNYFSYRPAEGSMRVGIATAFPVWLSWGIARQTVAPHFSPAVLMKLMQKVFPLATLMTFGTAKILGEITNDPSRRITQIANRLENSPIMSRLLDNRIMRVGIGSIATVSAGLTVSLELNLNVLKDRRETIDTLIHIALSYLMLANRADNVSTDGAWCEPLPRDPDQCYPGEADLNLLLIQVATLTMVIATDLIRDRRRPPQNTALPLPRPTMANPV